MTDKTTDDLVQEIIDTERGADDELRGYVVRYAIVAEVVEQDADDVTLDIISSENLPSWQMRGLGWALSKYAEDLHLRA